MNCKKGIHQKVKADDRIVCFGFFWPLGMKWKRQKRRNSMS